MLLTLRKRRARRAEVTYGESPDRSRLQNVLVLVAIVAAGLIFLGFAVASDPATYAEHSVVDSPAKPAPARPGLLSLSDQSHNDRMRAMRDVLERRGYWIDGRKPICSDPRGAIDGLRDLIGRDDPEMQFKWRLAAARYESARPQSFVLVRRHGQPFSPDVAERLAAEWTSVATLPQEAIDAGRDLLMRLVTIRLHDTDQSAEPISERDAAYIVRREWERSTDPIQRAIYRLELHQVTAEYQLEAELLDVIEDADEPPSSQLVLDFRWLGSAVTP